MPKRDDVLLKEDVLNAFKNILSYTKNHTFESFSNSQTTFSC